MESKRMAACHLQLAPALLASGEAVYVAYRELVAGAYVYSGTQLQAAAQEGLHCCWCAAVGDVTSQGRA